MVPLNYSISSLKIRKLVFGNGYNQALQVGDIPSTVEELEFGFSFNQPLPKGCIPEGVKELRFGYSFNQAIEPDSFPDSITHLNLGFKFDQPIKGRLPRGLKYLKISNRFNQPLEIGMIPHGVTQLEFLNYIPDTIPDGFFPDSVTDLSFKNSVAPEFQSRSTIPSSVVNLLFLCSLNDFNLLLQSFIPSTVENLIVAGQEMEIKPSSNEGGGVTITQKSPNNNNSKNPHYRLVIEKIQPASDEMFSSNKITHLEFDLDCLNSPISKDWIPSSVNHISFRGGSNSESTQWWSQYQLDNTTIFPPTVTHLTFGRDYGEDLPPNIPTSVTRLSIANLNMSISKIPASIIHLEFILGEGYLTPVQYQTYKEEIINYTLQFLELDKTQSSSQQQQKDIQSKTVTIYDYVTLQRLNHHTLMIICPDLYGGFFDISNQNLPFDKLRSIFDKLFKRFTIFYKLSLGFCTEFKSMHQIFNQQESQSEDDQQTEYEEDQPKYLRNELMLEVSRIQTTFLRLVFFVPWDKLVFCYESSFSSRDLKRIRAIGPANEPREVILIINQLQIQWINTRILQTRYYLILDNAPIHGGVDAIPILREMCQAFEATVLYPSVLDEHQEIGLQIDNLLNEVIPLERLPVNSEVVELVFSQFFNKPLSNRILNYPGVKIRKLVFGVTFNQFLHPGDLPTTLEELQFGLKFNQPIPRGAIPEGVLRLTFGYYFNQELEDGSIPSTVTYLDLGYSFDHQLYGKLPSGLKELVTSSNYSQDNIVGTLPYGVKNVKFKNIIIKKFPEGFLPNSITDLCFYDRAYNLSIISIPPSVVNIKLQGNLIGNKKYLQTFKQLILPTGSIVNITACDQNIKNEMVPPENYRLVQFTEKLDKSTDDMYKSGKITYLEFDFGYTSQITKEMIPSSVTHLKINGNVKGQTTFLQSEIDNNDIFPDTVKHLIFGKDFFQELPPIPSSITTLTLDNLDSFSKINNPSLQVPKYNVNYDQMANFILEFFGKNYNRNTLYTNLDKITIQSIVNDSNTQQQQEIEIRFENKFNEALPLGVIPVNTFSLIFSYTFNQSISNRVLNFTGVQIRKLVFGTGFNQVLKPGDIPSTVEDLQFGYNFDQPLVPGVIPEGVLRLTLSVSFNQALYSDSIPNSVTYLDMGKMYNRPINWRLPSGLTTLLFSKCIIWNNFPDSLPHGVKSVTFKNYFTNKLKEGFLPNTVKDLCFNYHAVTCLTAKSIPPSVINLTFNGDKHRFQTYYDSLKDFIPPTVQCLVICGKRVENQYYKEILNSPPEHYRLIQFTEKLDKNTDDMYKSGKITYLEFEFGYTSQITKEMIPSSVTHLKINGNVKGQTTFLQSEIDNNEIFPETVKHLIFGKDFIQELPPIPSTITTLTIINSMALEFLGL
eukprot:gene9033-11065_t